MCDLGGSVWLAAVHRKVPAMCRALHRSVLASSHAGPCLTCQVLNKHMSRPLARALNTPPHLKQRPHQLFPIPHPLTREGGGADGKEGGLQKNTGEQIHPNHFYMKNTGHHIIGPCSPFWKHTRHMQQALMAKKVACAEDRGWGQAESI